MNRALPVLACAFLAGCAAPAANTPSLARRPAETIDPRVPIPSEVVPGPADPSVSGRLAQLVQEAQGATGRFDAAMRQAERLASSAGARQSDSWIAAQQALSAAVAERYPVTRALSEIDELATAQVKARGGVGAADLANIQRASAEVGAIDEAQARRIAAVQARLGG